MNPLKNMVYMLALLSFSALAHPGHDGLGKVAQEGLLWVVMGVVCVGVVGLAGFFMHLYSAKDDG